MSETIANTSNVSNGPEFRDAFAAMIESVAKVISLCKERSNDQAYIPYSQMLGATNHPDEFLRCLLDILAVTFQPDVALGDMLLNGNPNDIKYGIPHSSFQLGYFTLTSELDQEFQPFLLDRYLPALADRYPAWNSASSMFVIISSSSPAGGYKNLNLCLQELVVGLSPQECLQKLVGSLIESWEGECMPNRNAGNCIDPELLGRYRISCWLFN